MDHSHPGFDVPDDADPFGDRGVDGKLLGSFVGAAFDGCTSCQDAILTLLVQNAPTTARLVELACIAVHSTLGGLPPALLTPTGSGPTTPEFAQLARAGLDGDNTAMFALCETMSPEQRRAAANTAADLLIGQL
ncbi:hypothetical protein [Nocardia sp. IFM 10818]